MATSAITIYGELRAALVAIHGTGSVSSRTGARLPKLPRLEGPVIAGMFAPSVLAGVEKWIDEVAAVPADIGGGGNLVTPELVGIPARLDGLRWLLGKPTDRTWVRVVDVKGKPVRYVMRFLSIGAPVEKARELLEAWDDFYAAALKPVMQPADSTIYASSWEVENLFAELYKLITRIDTAGIAILLGGSTIGNAYEAAASAGKAAAGVVGDVPDAAIDTAADVAGRAAEGAADALNSVSAGFFGSIGLAGIVGIVALVMLKRYKLI